MSPLPDPTTDEQNAEEHTAEAAGTTDAAQPGRPGSDAWVDAESAASFPASDPPSDWAGGDDSGQDSRQGMA